MLSVLTVENDTAFSRMVGWRVFSVDIVNAGIGHQPIVSGWWRWNLFDILDSGLFRSVVLVAVGEFIQDSSGGGGWRNEELQQW